PGEGHKAGEAGHEPQRRCPEAEHGPERETAGDLGDGGREEDGEGGHAAHGPDPPSGGCSPAHPSLPGGSLPAVGPGSRVWGCPPPAYFIVGITNSAPSLTPLGQREVTVLVLV